MKKKFFLITIALAMFIQLMTGGFSVKSGKVLNLLLTPALADKDKDKKDDHDDDHDDDDDDDYDHDDDDDWDTASSPTVTADENNSGTAWPTATGAGQNGADTASSPTVSADKKYSDTVSPSVMGTDQNWPDTISSSTIAVDETISINKATIANGVNYLDVKATPLQAFELFMKAHPGASVTDVKMDTINGQLLYKVEGYDTRQEYQLRIDAVLGAVLYEETQRLDQDDLDDAILTWEDMEKVLPLLDKAMKAAGDNLKFKEWTVDGENRNIEFEIEFLDENNHKVEYTYNLNTSELIKTDRSMD